MSQDTTNIVVNALLQVGLRVLELNDAGKITGEWERSGAENKLRVISNANLLTAHLSITRSCIKKRQSDEADYNIQDGDTVWRYKVRFIATHPDPSKLFLVLEYIDNSRTSQVTEEYWKTALDAAGDGMWDVDVPTRKITFSKQWHDTFGYNKEQIKTVDEWVALIHPDDVDETQRNRLDYFDGKTRYYETEFRFLTEKGEYRWVTSRGIVAARDPEGATTRFLGVHADITERKNAERAHAATAELLSRLINNLNEGVLVTDEFNKIVFANQQFRDRFYESNASIKLEGTSMFEDISARMVFFKTPQRCYERIMEILQAGKLVVGEELEMNDGSILSRDFIPLMLGRDYKGAIWKFRDITDQKLAEKNLADIRTFYETILNNIAADIVVFDKQSRYIFINPSAIKDPEVRQGMIGKTDEEYGKIRNRPAEQGIRRRNIFNQARDEKREIAWEEVLVNRKGETEYHMRYHYPVFDGQGNHLYGIGYGFNITDRVKAQQQLRISRDTFAGAFNQSGIGMALISKAGKWLDVNQMLCNITGYRREEMLQLHFQDITHPDDLERDIDFLKKMAAGDTDTYIAEKRYISREGKIVNVLLTSSVVRDQAGKPDFLVTQVMDITSRKEMEWELKKKNLDLEAAHDTLLTKINQLEELSHIIAHNLRGPAGNIQMLAEAVLEMHNGESKNAISNAFTPEEATKLIFDASSSLLDSLGSLMQITQIKLNKDIPKDACDIATVVNDVCNQLQSSIYEQKANIVKHLEISEIHYPRPYMENILYNLVSNALKYVRPDVTPEIVISTRKTEDRIQLSVKDNGLGIDLDKYGDRIFRLNQVFHEGYESKGIGLYITKTQVESFGGSITVNSKPNEGAEFIVTF